MPGKHCAISACSNRQARIRNSDGRKAVFHPFPKDILLRKQWIAVCRSAGTCKPDSYFICSHHFRPNDYVRKQTLGEGRPSKKRILRADALPSHNLGGPKEAAQSTVKGNRSLRRFCTLDALRNKPSPVKTDAENRKIQLHLIRTRINQEACRRCSELEERIELLKVRSSRLTKRIEALEAEILMLIE